MAEEMSTESKLYVKEEIEKLSKEFKQDLKEAQSKATKTFTAVALIIGLLASVGVLGLAKNYVNTALSNTTIKTIETRANDLYDKIAEYEKEAKEANDIFSKMKMYEQLAEPNGYAWIGNIKFVWGKRTSTKDAAETFYFVPKDRVKDKSKYNFNKECFAVTTSLGGRFTRGLDRFSLDRHHDYKTEKLDLYFVAIGN